jgi:hypothetical protein
MLRAVKHLAQIQRGLAASLPGCLAAFQPSPTSSRDQTEVYHAKPVLFQTNPLSIWATRAWALEPQ